MAEKQQEPQDKERKEIPGLPDQTMDEIRQEIKRDFPTFTDEEIDLWLSSHGANTSQEKAKSSKVTERAKTREENMKALSESKWIRPASETHGHGYVISGVTTKPNPKIDKNG